MNEPDAALGPGQRQENCGLAISAMAQACQDPTDALADASVPPAAHEDVAIRAARAGLELNLVAGRGAQLQCARRAPTRVRKGRLRSGAGSVVDPSIKGQAGVGLEAGRLRDGKRVERRRAQACLRSSLAGSPRWLRNVDLMDAKALLEELS